MKVSTHQAGKLRKSDSIPSIGKQVLSNPKRPYRLYVSSVACQGIEEHHFVAVKRPEPEAIFCCTV